MTKPDLIAGFTFHLYDSRSKFYYIDNKVWTKQTDIILTTMCDQNRQT